MQLATRNFETVCARSLQTIFIFGGLCMYVLYVSRSL